LLIDEIGKDVSGTGLDTNVVGRKFDDHKAVEGEFPKVKLIVVRGLTKATHGNAVGLGCAEFCKSQLLREMDLHATRLNAITAGHVPAALTPLDYETDREILDLALGTIGLVDPPNARLLWITNTLELAELECSAAYLDEARCRGDLEVLTPLRDLPLDAAGNLPTVKSWR
ncbi:MAG: [Fe-S]-binding protein, partial [Anaerolineae bacterium]|nr:[Fe-S]-binding protein [Anaerolineae bacterium]